MPIRLNGPLLRDLVHAAGGVEAFLDAWVRASPDPNDKISKANVSRWINNRSWLKDSAKFLRLAALLDVDPFALLATEDDDPVEFADRLINFIQNRRAVPAATAFMHGFFGRRKEWPPRLDGDGRAWHCREFDHDPARRANCYALIRLESEARHLSVRPQTFHFAYRHPVNFGQRWLQYGCVFRLRSTASLWHINGHVQQIELAGLEATTPVTTWFGPSPAIFRVASLHEFKLSVSTEYPDDSPSLVFPG